MKFTVAGPFIIPRHGPKKLINLKSLRDLETELESRNGLADACGCYVFAVRAGKGYTPYYVGQSQKSSILAEALNSTNREKYNEVLANSNGNPVVFLIPLLTPTGKFRKQVEKGQLPAVHFLEGWLIGEAIKKNPHLINNKRTKYLRSIHVVGYFNAKQGEAHGSSKELSRALN